MPTRLRPSLVLLLSGILALPLLVACEADRDPAAPPSPEKSLAARTLDNGRQEIVGEIGPGALYYLARPADWNGQLIVYAHGFVQPFLPVALPTEDQLLEMRQQLLAQGFGIAYSSYSVNGWAAKDGAQRTHQLSGLFRSAFGPPSRTYLVGSSLGGLIVEYLAERFPRQYDGALSLSGAVAGGIYDISYVADFRVLFDWFFPGVLPGSLYSMPAGYHLAPGSPAYEAVVAAVTAHPDRAAALASIEQIDLEVDSPQELLESFLVVLGYQINNADAFSRLLHGHGFYDNRETRYTSPLLDAATEAALNAGVARYAPDPAAVNYLKHWWQPAGRIGIPFLTLHTTRDPLVPFRVETVFRDLVEDAGRGDLLLQRSIDRFGHSNLTSEEITAAFLALAQWVQTGVRPADGP